MPLRAGRPSPCGEAAGPSGIMREPMCLSRAARVLQARQNHRQSRRSLCLRVEAGGGPVTVQKKRAEPVTVRIGSGPERRLEVVVTPKSTAAAPAQSARLKDTLVDLFMPPNWPQSTSDDFLPYVMYGLPTHICGWIMHSMTTTSLLRAVGAEPGTAAVAATSAAIKWLSKDGLGALGRLLVGSRLGVSPDVDPKLMRMYAELIALVGSALELSTGFYPQFFFYSAGIASALRTVGKGISSPAHTAFRLHFSRDDNIGAVTAKEEVFEVMAELCGLATSVVILQSGVTQNENSIVIAWVLAAVAHFTCRYLAIRSLNLEEVNCKRAVLLARHFAREGRIPTAAELSAEEPVLLPVELVAPRIHIGCKPQEALPAIAGGAGEQPAQLGPLRWGAELAASARAGASTPSSGVNGNGNGNGSGNGGAAEERRASSNGAGPHSNGAGHAYALAGGDVPCDVAAELYGSERYVLTVRGGSVYIALREDARSEDVLKAVWQAVALEQTCQGQMTPEECLAAANDVATGGRAFAQRVVEAGWKPEMLMRELDSRQRYRVEKPPAPGAEQQAAAGAAAGAAR